MYHDREFWRNIELATSSDDMIKEITDQYILTYQKEDPDQAFMDFLQFQTLDDFATVTTAFIEKFRAMGLTQFMVNARQSDQLHISDETIKSLGGRILVELSECGVAITQKIVDQLTQPLPDGYSIRELRFDELRDRAEIFEMIFRNFKEGFALSVDILRQRFLRGHRRSIKKREVRLYHLIEHAEQPVSFSLTQLYPDGPRKGLVHLSLGVTDKEHQRKGLYKVLLKARFSAALQRDYKFAHAESDVDTSRPILEKLGLEEFDRTRLYLFTLK